MCAGRPIFLFRELSPYNVTQVVHASERKEETFRRILVILPLSWEGQPQGGVEE